MAKISKTAPPPEVADADTAPETAVAAGGYVIEDIFLPAARAIGQRSEGTSYPFHLLPLRDGPNKASFIEGITVSESITDEKERAAQFADDAKRVRNKITGAISRHLKALRATGVKDADLPKFTVRTVNSAGLGTGVRVYRVG